MRNSCMLTYIILTYMHTVLHTYKQAHIHTDKETNRDIHIHKVMHLYILFCIHTYTPYIRFHHERTHQHQHKHKHKHTHKHKDKYASSHKHTHTHPHTHTRKTNTHKSDLCRKHYLLKQKASVLFLFFIFILFFASILDKPRSETINVVHFRVCLCVLVFLCCVCVLYMFVSLS